MTSNPTILVVEDKPNERAAMTRLLRVEDFRVRSAGNPEQALAYLEEPIDLVISDLKMGESSGIDLLQYWKRRQPRTPFIMMTGYGDVDSAVDAIKQGAEDYLNKPVNPDELLVLIDKCLTSPRQDEASTLPPRREGRLGFEEIIGGSQAMLEVFDQARRAAQVDSTVLITGESGTGKELVAQAIHQNGPRKEQSFVTVNMAAVPENLVESELFGHSKGAFTGATNSRVGRFAAAEKGTIFIDEIGDFVLTSQAKLLRVLENRTVTPVGSNEEQEIDVRVVAATSRDLSELVANEEFREDLYYRLAVVTIQIPPLRDRREDIPLLVRSFLEDLCEVNKRPLLKITPELLRFLEAFEWPGNVRQLRNCVESMVVLAKGDTLSLDSLPASLNANHIRREVNIPTGITLKDLERTAVEQTLEKFDGNRTHTANTLGISVRTLQRKLKDWGTNGDGWETPPSHRFGQPARTTV